MPDGSPVFDEAEMGKYGRFPNSPELPADIVVDAGTPPSEGGTAIVGSYPPNAWGLYDMLGNVMELCLDAWVSGMSFYDPSVVHVEPVGPFETVKELKNRVVRGGHWGSVWSLTGRSFININYINGESLTEYMGFRVCLTLP